MWFDFLKRGKKEVKKKEVRYILAVDGGGMRGIVPAFILKKTGLFMIVLNSNHKVSRCFIIVKLSHRNIRIP